MLLQVDHINKSYDGRPVLRDISFGVEPGEVVGLVGNNGAGKTTLLRIITRIAEPDSGRILYDGHPITSADTRHIGYLPEERGLYRHQPAGGQAVFLARMKGLSATEAKEAVDWWFDHLGISDWRNKPVAKLSKGMQQKLQFLVTVAHNPRLLILDEPFSGFDQPSADMLCSEIRRLASQGTAIILSTHNPVARQLMGKTIHLQPL